MARASESPPLPGAGVSLVKLSEIRPPKHRMRHDIGDIGELKASMEQHGLIHPIVIRPVGEWQEGGEGKLRFEVVVGHRRYVAAHELGWEEIPAQMKEVSDQKAFEMALIENVQRQTMNPKDEGDAFVRYVVENGWGSQLELAKKIGKSPQYVSERVQFAEAPEDIIHGVERGQLTLSHAEELSRLDNQQASELSEKVVDSALSSQQTRIAVDYVKQGLQPEQAVQRVLEFPDLAPPKPSDKFDPVRTAREGIYLTLEKALKQTDFHLSFIPDGEEKQEWVHQVRFPLHELTNAAIVVRKKHEPRDD